MAIPTVAVTTTNLDAGTDSPALARADLLDLVQKFNLLIAELSTTPAAGDIPIVDSSSRIAATCTSADDADKVDNAHATTTPTASAIPIAAATGKIANGWLNTGAGGGIDADKLDGSEGSAYAKLVSPAFTGSPTAPTATAGTNSTQIATTAFVQAALGAMSYSFANPGYIKFPGGFEIKFGTMTIPAAQNCTSGTYATAFAHGCLGVILTPKNSAVELAVVSPTASGLSVSRGGSTMAPLTLYYISIGY